MGNWSVFGQASTTDPSSDLSQTRAPGPDNEIGTVTNSVGNFAQPTYDSAGNMTTMPIPGNESVALMVTYDAWNRPVTATDGAAINEHYVYDGLGRLIETQSDFVDSIPQAVTHYYYAGDQLLETRDASGPDASTVSGQSLSPHYQYVWSISGENAPILRDTYSSGSLVTGDRLYYLTDANSNVTAVIDASGAVQERYSYDAYGNVTVYTADWSSSSPSSSSLINNTLLFGGMQRDAQTNLYYDRARWYNPSTGGFISQDPAQADANLYRYVGNDPVDGTDPSGMDQSGDGTPPTGSSQLPGKPAMPRPTPDCTQGPGYTPHYVSYPNGKILFASSQSEEDLNNAMNRGPSTYDTLALSNSDSSTHDFHLNPPPVNNSGPTVSVGGVIASWWNSNNVGTRLAGGLRQLGGVAEVASSSILIGISGVMEAGSLGTLTPAAAGVAALALLIGVHGIDDINAGYNQVATGVYQRTAFFKLDEQLNGDPVGAEARDRDLALLGGFAGPLAKLCGPAPIVAPNNPLQNEINALEKEVADQQQFAENWRNALDNAVERGQEIDPQDAAGVRRAFDKLEALRGVLENLKSVPQGLSRGWRVSP